MQMRTLKRTVPDAMTDRPALKFAIAILLAASCCMSAESQALQQELPRVRVKLRSGEEKEGGLKSFAGGRLEIVTPSGNIEYDAAEVARISFAAAHPSTQDQENPNETAAKKVEKTTEPARNHDDADRLEPKVPKGAASEWRELWRLRKKARTGNLTPAEEKLHGELKRKWENQDAEPLSPAEKILLEKLRAKGRANLTEDEREALVELTTREMRPELRAAYMAALEAKDEGRLDREIEALHKEIQETTDSRRLLSLFLKNSMYLKVRNETALPRDIVQNYRTTMNLLREKRPLMTEKDVETMAIILPEVLRPPPRGDHRNDAARNPPFRKIRENDWQPEGKAGQ